MKTILALAFQKLAESNFAIISEKNIKKSDDYLWKSIILIQHLEFRLFPEQKTEIMPLRLSMENLHDFLTEFQTKHIFPNRHIDCNIEMGTYHNKYHEVITQFKLLYTKHQQNL